MSSTHRFTDQVVFVTGAAGGIGRATAIAFAQEGARVAIVDRTEDVLADTANAIRAAGAQVLVIACDISQPDQVAAAVEQAVSKFGRIDIAFNNAGVDSKIAQAADIELAEWDRVMDINVRGAFVCMKHELTQMVRQGGGVIVNTASVAGIRGIPGRASYAASKHALIGLTKSAALDYAAHNIRINAVLPGVIETPMIMKPERDLAPSIARHPVGRLGRPEEIANAVLWLSTELSGFVTGAAITIDGGYSVG